MALAAVLGAMGVGCIGSPAQTWTVASVRDMQPPPKLVKQGVVGEDCPSRWFSYGSYAVAMEAAISSAPGSNAVANAKFYSQERVLGIICVRVSGDAVAVE
jgi:hypothetical protein